MSDEFEKMAKEMALENTIEKFDYFRKFKSRQEKIEFTALCYELIHKNFKSSPEASIYITSNKLGYKYRHISGYLTLENSEKEWILKGGFPSHIFAMLCYALGLKDNNTSAKPKKFVPFSKLGTDE